MGTNINKLTAAIAIHPGELLLDELKALGISQVDFAKKVGMEKSQLNEVIKGKRGINAELAVMIEGVLGMSAQYWMNLQSTYEIDCVKVDQRHQSRIDANKILEEIKEDIAIKYLRKQ